MATVAVRERPILFSGPMVRAILEGRKTQTQRVVKGVEDFDDVDRLYDTGVGEAFWRFSLSDGEATQCHDVDCPYGHVDNRLWVRETWFPDPPQDGSWPYYDFTDGAIFNFAALPERFRNPKHVIHRATWTGPDLRWRPSIHMPRWACRLTLEITGVRVERLHDISETDKEAEGGTADRPFGTVWRAINTKPGIRWEDNPWVWVIEFQRLKTEPAT